MFYNINYGFRNDVRQKFVHFRFKFSNCPVGNVKKFWRKNNLHENGKVEPSSQSKIHLPQNSYFVTQNMASCRWWKMLIKFLWGNRVSLLYARIDLDGARLFGSFTVLLIEPLVYCTHYLHRMDALSSSCTYFQYFGICRLTPTALLLLSLVLSFNGGTHAIASHHGGR